MVRTERQTLIARVKIWQSDELCATVLRYCDDRVQRNCRGEIEENDYTNVRAQVLRLSA